MVKMPKPVERPESPLRAMIDGGREALQDDLLSGVASAVACARLAYCCDKMVLSAIPETGSQLLSFVATGGWGRRQMCPQSDLDLLVLAADPAAASEDIEAVLYPMWDAGINVGHAIRSPAEIERLALADVKTATALLDARLLAGDEQQFKLLEFARRRAVAPGGDPSRFVRQLIDERDRRHRRFGDSIYLLEPNIKHGIGALRDLATALWVARVRFGRIDASELVRSGQLSSRQAAVLKSAQDFFLRVRSLLQGQTGRASDQLTFEVQEAIAPILYPDAQPLAHKPAVAPSVEALMRDYYVHASGVTQVMTQLFEAASVSRRRRPTVAKIDSSFVLFSGKISVASSGVFEERPEDMVRAFRTALELQVPIHWHTRELIAERALGELGLDLTRNQRAGSYFLAALVDASDRRKPTLLEEMHRVGLVSAVIPEFAACTGRVQHDLYHVYTVDQHQLNAVNLLKRIARGEHEELSLATSVYRELEDTAVLYLATILHDVGKPLGKGHSESGAKIAKAAALRFGLGQENAERAALLVRHHLTMSHISQRRDLSDPDVIRRFADHVGDLRTLRELLLLTICDAAMTAPGNLSPWKQQLLFDAYNRTRALFLGDGASLVAPQDAASRTRERTRALLQQSGKANAEALTDGLDDHLATALSPRQLHRLLSLVPAAEGAPLATSLRSFPLKGHSEIAIVAPDGRGLLAAVTGALDVARIVVEGAIIGSLSIDGKDLASDTFFVSGTDGGALAASDPRWQRFNDELGAMQLAEGAAISERVAASQRDKLGPRVTPAVMTEVGFATDASDRYSVLEVFTLDRVGLLSDIASTLAALDIYTHLAKVSTEGERAADIFYVVDGSERKPLKQDRQREVVEALNALFESPAQ